MTEGLIVGRVRGLWRYPVKSMLGESMSSIHIDHRGVVGDRCYALWDHATSRVASAKNPHLWKDLLSYTAAFTYEPKIGEPLPPITVDGPFAGAEAAPITKRSDDPAFIQLLSAHLGRDLELLDQAPPNASLDQYWPDIRERDFQNITTELRMPEGTFFDACPIHAISTATLKTLQEREPSLDFAVERFRPNLLIEPTGTESGFVEEEWIEGILSIGDQVKLQVDGGCPRCVVTTLAQSKLPEEMEILRATARHNKVTAGVRLSVRATGQIKLNDPITWQGNANL